MNRTTALLHNLPYNLDRGSPTPLLTGERRRLSELAFESSANLHVRIFIDSNLAGKFWEQGSFNFSAKIQFRRHSDLQPPVKIIDLVAVLQESLKRNKLEP